MFSSMCAICVVPGMGTIQGFCAVSQRDLGGRGTRPFGPALDQFDQRHVVLQVLRRESGLDAANVAGCEARVCVDGPGEEPTPSGLHGTKPMPSLALSWHWIAYGVPGSPLPGLGWKSKR